MTSSSTVSSSDASRRLPDPPTGWFGLASEATPSPRRRAVVLVVGATDAERCELRAPLDGIEGVRVIEAWSVTAALEISREVVVHLLVADVTCAEISRTLPWLPAVVVVNPGDPTQAASCRTQVVLRPVPVVAMREILDGILRS